MNRESELSDEELAKFQTLPVHASLLQAQKAAKPGDYLALCVRVSSIRNMAPLFEGQENQYVKGVFLQDLAKGTPIDTVPTTDLLLCSAAEQFAFSGEVAVAYGYFAMTPIRYKSKIKRQRFVLLHLRPSRYTQELLGAQREEMALAQAKRKEICKVSGAFEAYLRKRLAAIHQVVETSMSARFSLAIKLILLQALSDGGVSSNANQRLSTYITSEPGQGKGLLAKYAETLAPLFSTAQPALTTVAGLSVRIEQRKDVGWESKPGAIPQAYRGVMTSHDTHRYPEKDASAFQAIFMATAEEGVYTPAKASNTPFVLECALHLNGNHRHLVEGRPCPEGPRARLADIGMALDLFSRIDVVMSLCIGDEIRPLSENFAVQNLDGAMDRKEQEAAIRELKLLCADARDEIRTVDLRPIEKQLRQAQRDTVRILQEQMVGLQGAEASVMPVGALLMRVARTYRKLIIANARLDGRSFANESDLAIAKEMLRLKMEMVRWICGTDTQVMPQGSFERMLRRAEAQAEERHLRILEKCGGRGALPAEEIAGAVGVSVRTILRDLLELGIQQEAGRYEVPKPIEWERKKTWAIQEARRKAEEAGQEYDANREELDFLAFQRGGKPAVLTEDEIAEQMDPEQDKDRGAIRFYDTLPRVPFDLRQASKALFWIEITRQYTLLKMFLKFAVTEKLDMDLYYGAKGIAEAVDTINFPEGEGALHVLIPILRDDDWEKRAGIVLALYSSNPELPAFLEFFEEQLERTDLPEPIRRHLESAYRRQLYFFERGSDVQVRF